MKQLHSPSFFPFNKELGCLRQHFASCLKICGNFKLLKETFLGYCLKHKALVLFCFVLFFHTSKKLAERSGRTLFQEATQSSKLTLSYKVGSQTSPFSLWIPSEWRFLRLLTILSEGDTYSLFSFTLNIIFQAFWEALLHFYEETPTANLEIFFETSNTRCSVQEGKEAAPYNIQYNICSQAALDLNTRTHNCSLNSSMFLLKHSLRVSGKARTVSKAKL